MPWRVPKLSHVSEIKAWLRQGGYPARMDFDRAFSTLADDLMHRPACFVLMSH